jgi:EAL domain-containing protein (putative c-di-GMP-specific phosphodiesterase class I)
MSLNSLLVLDDEPDVCEFIKDVAEDMGFDVETATDHDQFRRLYRSFNPAIIVLDLQMPKADGIELLRFLAASGCQARILLVSGVDPRVLATARQLGVSRGLKMLGALSKPFAIEDLETLLRKAMQVEPSVTEGELKRAIEEGQLTVFYQPKARLKDNTISIIEEAEALARWQHPAHGLVTPNAFIPLAEKTGLIGPLTDYVLKSVARQLKSWHDEGVALSASVNLAPQLLTQLQLPDHLARLLDDHEVEHSRLTLEITESAAMSDTIRTMDILARFRVKNIGLSIDDFGTGYSSLVELHRTPFNELKVDKSFVLDIEQNKDSEIIVRSIVTLAHNLGLSVCAEGVESPAALELLRGLRCEKIQGFLLSRPMPASQVASFAQRHNRPTN